MKLLDQDTINALPALYSTEGTSCDEKQIVCKFFNFGYCDLGLGSPEWGYVSLRELESVKLPFGMGIERDIYFSPKTISL